MGYKYVVYVTGENQEKIAAERSRKQAAFKIAAEIAQRECYEGIPCESVFVYAENPAGDSVNKWYFNEDGEMYWEVGRGWGN